MRKGLSVVSRTGLVAVAGAILGLSGCSSLGFYWQGFKGQMQIMQAARPIAQWQEQEDLPPAVRLRLQAALKMREFAIQELGLPDNASYTRYADLKRPFSVWNVVAAPPDSLELHRWCFPIAGCVGYRGYFSASDAQAQASELQAQGLEVSVYGVPTFSTLGYLNWMGGDPLLNTFVDWPEGDFAGLLFHELAHQVLYVAGDTAFNESFATSVERIGIQRWLQTHASAAGKARWAQSLTRRKQWRDLTGNTKAELRELYSQKSESNQALANDPNRLAAIKSDIFTRFKSSYQNLRTQWIAQDEPMLTTPALRQQYLARIAQTDEWVEKANNASFGAMAAYDDWVPAFTALWQEKQAKAPSSAQGWRDFYAAVGDWGKLSEPQRLQALCSHVPQDSPQPLACRKE